MRLALAPALLIAAAAGAGAADLEREMQLVDQVPVPVSNRQEVTVSARDDKDVRHRELWYARREAQGWGAWQKHGLVYGRETPIAWAPPEGHWRIYVRIVEVSGLAMPAPDQDTDPKQIKQFIIDRTAPAVRVTFPADGARLRGGHGYKVTWQVEDPHLHSRPVTIRWARSGEDKFTVLAEHVPNTGSFDWTTPLDMTANGRVEILATDRAGNTGNATSANLIVDAVAPSRNILGPGISASREVNLAIRAQDAGPSGLDAVQLFYSADDGATWNAGPEQKQEPFTTLPWNAPADGSYLLSLVARDRAGNVTDQPKGKAASQFTCLVDTQRPGLSLASPIGVADPDQKPDAPPRRIFKPGDRVLVAFSVQDANVRQDGVSVLLQAQEGARWEVLASGLAPDKPYAFAIPDIDSATARIKVQAIDVAGNQGEIVAQETFRVDNKVESGGVDVDL